MHRERDVGDAMRPKLHARALDRQIRRIAERQHGVLALGQLVAAGACPRAVGRRIERETLRVVHRGVYVFGCADLGARGRTMAAVLAGGEGSAASHLSAARLWDLPAPPGAAAHVTVPRARRRRRGIVFHRSALAADELTFVGRIRVTTVARTLLDLASILPRYRLETALNEAEYRGLADLVPLSVLVERHAGRRGVKAMRALLTSLTLGDDRTASELEDRFAEFIAARRLPRPGRNVPLTVGGQRIHADCAWIEESLIVELDGRAAHARRSAFESDRARDRALQAAGWRVVRVTWAQLHTAPDALERDLRTLLGAKRAERRPRS
jgi:very-short-patch-repair endonuclease